jgi:hypothetical protein
MMLHRIFRDIDNRLGPSARLTSSIRQPKRNPHHVLLQLVLNDLQEEPSAWPFTKPVDGNVVHDYYEVIKEPMGKSSLIRSLCLCIEAGNAFISY